MTFTYGKYAMSIGMYPHLSLVARVPTYWGFPATKYQLRMVTPRLKTTRNVLQVYEMIRLRQFFFAEMERVQPQSVNIFKRSEKRVDIEKSVEDFTAEYSYGRIGGWFKGIGGGKEV
jgi:hypothetical protein